MFNIPASKTAVLRVEPPLESIASILPLVFDSLGWESDERVGAFCGVIRTSVWSWGEIATIDPRDNGRLVVDSRCRFPLQVVDWGKNAANIRQFAETLANISGCRVSAEEGGLT